MKLRAVCANIELFLVILADACLIMKSNRFHRRVLRHVSTGLVDGHRPLLLHQTLLDTVYIKACTRDDTQKCRSPSRVSRRSCILYPLRARCTDNVTIRNCRRPSNNLSSFWKTWASCRIQSHQYKGSASSVPCELGHHVDPADLGTSVTDELIRQGCTLGRRLD